jgi:hypothetical protein
VLILGMFQAHGTFNINAQHKALASIDRWSISDSLGQGSLLSLRFDRLDKLSNENNEVKGALEAIGQHVDV